jgi:hypothetical protein
MGHTAQTDEAAIEFIAQVEVAEREVSPTFFQRFDMVMGRLRA